ncbi:MAG: hypothetical protein ACXW2Q_11240 [Thermoanaerobaculia bacterium]
MLISVTIIVVLLPRECDGTVARWTDRSEGTIWIAPGMTREQVERRATTRMGQYGDSGRFVDFVLAGEGMRLRGIQMFMLTSGKAGPVESVSMITANETWPDLVRAAKRTESILIARGWKPAPGQRGVESLTSDPRDAAADVTGSGAIAGASFTWSKGRQEFTLAAGGLWSGIPWWRYARGAKVFWRNMTYVPHAEGGH